MTPITRRAIAGVTVAASALAMAACSSTDTTEETSAEPTASEAAEAAFPVTITGMYGDVTIEEAPSTIVVLGSREHELLYSLGLAPVLVAAHYLDTEDDDTYDHGSGPWATGARLAVGAEPDTFSFGDLDAELFLTYEPDLFVATYTDITQEEYDLLSQIAPVVVRGADDDAYGMSLADELTLIGEATGTSEKAAEVVAEVDGMFADAVAAHPEWEGQSSVVGFWYDGQAGVYISSDGRNQFLARLGFDVTVMDEYYDAEAFYTPLSSEQLDLLTTDSIVWQAASTPEARELIEGLPLYGETVPSQNNANIWITDPSVEAAFFANSPSSIAYVLDAMVPALEAAHDGDPSNEVPEVVAAQ